MLKNWKLYFAYSVNTMQVVTSIILFIMLIISFNSYINQDIMDFSWYIIRIAFYAFICIIILVLNLFIHKTPTFVAAAIATLGLALLLMNFSNFMALYSIAFATLGTINALSIILF